MLKSGSVITFVTKGQFDNNIIIRVKYAMNKRQKKISELIRLDGIEAITVYILKQIKHGRGRKKHLIT